MPIGAMLEVAVIIPHYNDVLRLQRCLEALMVQVDEAVEVVVADNASSDDLAPIRARWPQVQIVIQTEKGAGPARNKGVAATQAPWLMFIDADCIASPDWLSRGREIARMDTVIGGRVDVFHETAPPQSGAEAFETVFAFHMRDYLEKCAFLGSGNLVTSREVFDAVGGFRAAVAEDKDWSQRAARAGFHLGYEDSFVVGHPSRQDWAALRYKWLRLTSEGFLSEGQGSRSRWAMKGLLMPASAVAHAPRVLRHPNLTPLEKARAVTTLVKLRCFRMVWMLRQAITDQA